MDYGIIGNRRYIGLVKNVDIIGEMLKNKLDELEDLGYDPANGFIYGFSFGGRIAIMGGILYGPRRIAQIDVCDMAGPFFDKNPVLNSKAAAKNVQCIHTSSSKGTWARDCHQNWNMGFCGQQQLAADVDDNPQSHGMCNVFYNAAFENNFYAEAEPTQCPSAGFQVPYWPSKFKMGYQEKRKHLIQGQFYASTWYQYPFTKTRKLRVNRNNLVKASLRFINRRQ